MIIEKILLGVMLAAPIGPVSIEMIKRGLYAGFWAAFTVRLGGVIGNTLCLIFAYFGMSSILKHESVVNGISLFGSLFLIYMGVKGLLKKAKSIEADKKIEKNNFLNNISIGLLLSVANPVAVVFWLGIFAVSMSTEVVSFWQNSAIVLGVILWGAMFSLLLAGGKKYFSTKFINIITYISSIFLIFYGIKYSYLIYLKII